MSLSRETGMPNRSASSGNWFPQIIFSVLGVPSQIGRVLGAELDKSGDAPVVVISDRFWRNRLNSSPDVVGQTLRLNGQPATIVGLLRRVSMVLFP